MIVSPYPPYPLPKAFLAHRKTEKQFGGTKILWLTTSTWVLGHQAPSQKTSTGIYQVFKTKLWTFTKDIHF